MDYDRSDKVISKSKKMKRIEISGNISAKICLALIFLLDFSFLSFFQNTDIIGTHHLNDTKIQKKALGKKWILFPSEDEDRISIAWESDSTEYDPESRLTEFSFSRIIINNKSFKFSFRFSEKLISLLIDIPPPTLA